MSDVRTGQRELAPHLLPAPKKIGPLYDTLARVYGPLDWIPSKDPLSELVLTILSQHTSDLNRDRAFRTMHERFPTWEEVRDAPTDDLAASIRAGGLANIKAPRIQQVLRTITEERGELDISFLNDAPMEVARAWLSGLNGVGPKTAACVLVFACGHPALPVDTHVYRVSQRLGLTGARTNAEKAHGELEAIVEPAMRYSFHVYLIRHGREVCKAQRPLCEVCPVSQWCVYYASLRAGSPGAEGDTAG
jgi:endonuclease III